MTYFAMDDVSDQPKEHHFPEGLKDASLPEKQQWFHEQVYSMLDTFVMDSVGSLKDHSQDEEEIVKCCDPSKAKNPEGSKFDYGCLHLSLGLLIRDAEDALKEGDGDRLIRVWKFLTILFRLNGGNKYTSAGLRVQASILGLLTPEMPTDLNGIILQASKRDRGQGSQGTYAWNSTTRLPKET